MNAKRTSQELGRIHEVAASLNRESDKLTDSLRDVEEFLKQTALGVELLLKEPVHKETELSESSSGTTYEINYEYRLGYGKALKDGRQWGVYVEIDYGADPIIKGISEMPREIRVHAAKHIPQLLDELARKGEELVADIRSATEIVQNSVKKKQE